MIKPWYLAPLCAAAALAGSAYWWQAEKDRWTPPPPRKPDLPKVDPLPGPLRMRAKFAVERPLLWTSRKPIVVDEKKTNVVSELMQARLTAVLESGGARIYVDPKSARLLAGTVLDFTDGLNGQGFTFENPNATRTCGSGHSFSA